MAVVEASVVIPRHYVESDEDRLSHMQRELLRSDALVTVVSAPTGAGKSHVFTRAVLAGKQLLYIVPTQRLGQNLVSSLRRDLQDSGWDERKAKKKVVLWDGNSAPEEKARRATTYDQLDMEEGGECIFTTPETISGFMKGISRSGQKSDVGPVNIVTSKDYIVFDEYHLTEPRGFGLIALLAQVAKALDHSEPGSRRVKIVLLSATPVDISPVLREIGFDIEKDVNFVSEKIVEAPGRPLHGDVRIKFVCEDSIADLFASMDEKDLFLDVNSKCAIIYDSLADLMRDECWLRTIASEKGVSPSDLAIDSGIHSKLEKLSNGAPQAIENKRLIIGTSTIEVGVTIPDLRVLITAPGSTAKSLVQRIGRDARGSYDGNVIVVYSKHQRDRLPWLSQLISALKACGGIISVSNFNRLAAQVGGVEHMLKVPSDSADTAEKDILLDGAYGKLSRRAVAATALYWHILLEKVEISKLDSYYRILAKMAPPITWKIRKLIDVVRRLPGGDTWVNLFCHEASMLRSFTPTVRVISPQTSGDCSPVKRRQGIMVSAQWLSINTYIFDVYQPVLGADGNTEVHIDASIGEYMRPKGESGSHIRYIKLPGQRDNMLRVDFSRFKVDPVFEFEEAIARRIQDLDPSAPPVKALQSALLLVKMSGIVPYDNSVSVDSLSAVF